MHRLRLAATLATAFVRARRVHRFRSRAELLAWQTRRLRRFLAQDLRHVPFYASLAAQAANRPADDPADLLSGFPIVDKATMLADFAAFNAAGIELERARTLAQHAERARDFNPTLDGVTIGLSSGTTGRPGVFLASDRERAIWAGTILARALGPATFAQLCNPFAPKLRAAFFLRANSNLYTTVHGRRLDLHYFDLLTPFDQHIQSLAAMRPDLLVAPASVLHQLADAQRQGRLAIRPRQVLSVAEVLEPDDVGAVEAAWGLTPGQIYQCTEGFLGATCEAGTLHLNEDMLHIEPQWLDEARTRFVPLVTDFSRSTQAFVRHRLDDVLRVSDDPCPCGRVTLGIAAVEGRCDDMLWGWTHDGAVVPVFADAIRRAMLRAQQAAGFSDYQLVQDADRLSLSLQDDDGRGLQAVSDALSALADGLHLRLPSIHPAPWCDAAPAAKRRRIRCARRPGFPSSAPESASCASS